MEAVGEAVGNAVGKAVEAEEEEEVVVVAVVASGVVPYLFSWCPGVKSPRGMDERTREVGRSTRCPAPRCWFGGGIMLSDVVGRRTAEEEILVDGAGDPSSVGGVSFVPANNGWVARMCSGTGHFETVSWVVALGGGVGGLSVVCVPANKGWVARMSSGTGHFDM